MAVSCKAGLDDRDASSGFTGCFLRCKVDQGTENDYALCLDYCSADEEDKYSGFSGF